MIELPLIEPDEDLLPLLSEASNEMLDPLVGYITDNGEGRITSLLETLDVYKADDVMRAVRDGEGLAAAAGSLAPFCVRSDGITWVGIAEHRPGLLGAFFGRWPAAPTKMHATTVF